MKIAFTGVHGSGKTTIVNRIERGYRDMNIPYIPVSEVARDCPHPLNTFEGQRWIWYEQYRREVEAMSTGCDVICDRCLMDNLVYFLYIIEDQGMGSNAQESFAFFHSVTKVWMKSYDRVIRMPLNTEWIINDTEDTLRSKDVEYAKTIDSMFDDMLEEFIK